MLLQLSNLRFVRSPTRLESERGYEFSELDHRTNNSKQPHGLSNLIQHSRAARMFYSNSSQLRSERCTHPRSPPLATARSMINRRSRTNLVSGFYSRSYLFFFFPIFSSFFFSNDSSIQLEFLILFFFYITSRYNGYKKCENVKLNI